MSQPRSGDFDGWVATQHDWPPRIAHYKAPRSIDFVDELPRLATGKLAKRVLINQYVEAQP